MKLLTRFSRAAAAIVVGLLILTGVASAQTTLTSTTLSAAIVNASDQVMTIASTTGWTASSSSATTYAVIDREAVIVRAVNTTTGVVNIVRGQFSTRATGHGSGVKVFFIPAASFTLSNFDRAGACTTVGSADISQSGAVLPILNPTTGRSFSCLGSIWVEGGGLGQNACTVTQATNRTTGVTCQGLTGAITTNTTSLAAEASAAFVVTDAAVALGDAVVVSQRSGSNSGNTDVYVSAVTAGTFSISVADNNVAAGTAETGAIIINFVVVKAAP